MAVITSASNVQWAGIGTDGFDIGEDIRILVLRAYGFPALVRNGFGTDPSSGSVMTVALEGLVMEGDSFVSGTLKVTGSGFSFRPATKITQVEFTSTSDPGEKLLATGLFDGSGPAPTGTDSFTAGTFERTGYKLAIKGAVTIVTSPQSFSGSLSSIAITIDGYVVTLTGAITMTGAQNGTDPTFGGTITSIKITTAANTATVLYQSTGTSSASVLNVDFGSLGELLAALNANNDTANGNANANRIEGGEGADTLNGMAGADTIDGGAGNDSVDGGADGDTYIESAGDDTYVVAQSSDSIDGSGGGGIDTVRVGPTGNTAYLDISDDAWLEAVVYTGTAGVTLTGNDQANTLAGGSGNDVLVGGEGDDTYVVNNAADVVTETGEDDDDTMVVSVAGVSLAANVENLTLGGTVASGTGNAGDNRLVGNASANTLAGGGGNDTLEGGAGADVYVVDGGDTVTEIAATTRGIDLVRTSANFVLGANVEKATFIGESGGLLTGNGLNNTLTGGTGADTLDGDIGNDSMVGGGGNDVFVVGVAGDKVSEAAGGGSDTVRSAITYKLGANVDNLVLTGEGDLNGTGNGDANRIEGNAGANSLDGGLGNDTYVESAGNDIYAIAQAGDTIEGGGGGVDTVRVGASGNAAYLNLSDKAWLEAVTYTGTAGVTLTGNAGANTLAGGSGNDVLVGGEGDDTYVVNNAADVVSETGEEDDDTVVTSVTGLTLAANVENLTLAGTVISGAGNSLDNKLIGNAAANTLNGGTGSDTLVGGAGADVYIVDGDDTVVEAGDATGGIDLVRTSVSFTLGANLEKATFTADTGGLLVGNELNNTLMGAAGADTLDGGTGSDSMAGGANNDTYIVDAALDKVTEAAGGGNDTVRSAVTYVLGANIENLILTGSGSINATGGSGNDALTGNEGANSLTGGGGADTLDGGAGNDTLAGGAGNDVYILDANDSVAEAVGAGTDTVMSSTISISLASITVLENITLLGTGNLQALGSSGANLLIGNSGANTLNGGGGADTLQGGLGNDLYVVDGAEDKLSDTGGLDMVQAAIDYSLAADFEDLWLVGTAIQGTGNAANNFLVGNAAANSLSGGAGNDSLDGGAGADTLAGGADNDAYGVDNSGDSVIEAADGGSADLIIASVDFSLPANVERLTLATGATNGTGNAEGNVITGNSANNSLSGGAGADTMTGGAGNDSYAVDNASDSVVEAGGGGTADLISASVDFTLASGVENLALLTGATNGTGNSGNNSITGNSGNNSLSGGGGNDTLTGGDGDDTYGVDGSSDSVVETSTGGTDTVNSSATSFTLASNVENLVLTADNSSGTGSSGANSITGSSGANTLDGGSGNDTINAGDGNDVIRWDSADGSIAGGNGNDTLSLTGADEELALNTIDASIAGIEAIDLTGTGDNVLAVTAAKITSIGGGTLRVSGNDGDRVVIVDTGLANDSANGANQDSQNPWSHTGTTGGIATYTNGSVTLEVEDDVEVFMLNAMLDNAFVHYQDFRYPAFGFRELGQSAGDSAGAAIAAGDINGDGLDDFVTLASDNTVYHGAETIEGTGSAYVIFGDDRTGFDRNSTLVGFDGMNGFRIDGMVEDAEMEDVAVDDLNGDGYADIVIAAMKGAASVGHVYVIFGKADFTADLSVTTETVVDVPGATFETSYLSVEDLDGTNGFTLTADGTSHSVAIGDVTGDGRNDLIVGSPNEKWVNPLPQSTQEGDGNEGLVYVVYGKSTWAASATLDDAMAANFGERLIGTMAPSTGSSSSNWFAGDSVATADVNNDGLADVVIGQSGAMSTLSSQGFVHVVDATAINRPGDDYDFFNELFLLFDSELGIDRFDGESAGADLGEAVDSAGDVNGDGYEDIIFGARFQGGGAAYVIFGGSGPFSPAGLGSLDGTKGFKITSATVDDGLGGAVSAAGDVNGDGYGDLLVGAPSFEHNDTASFMNVRAGQAYVIYGKASWAGSFNVADLNGANGFTFQTTQNLSDRTGGAAAAAGDLDGDGFGDFLIGAPSGSPSSNDNQTQKGYTFVFYGGDLNGAVDQVGDVVDPEEEEPTYADSLSGDAGKDNIVAGLGNDTIDAGGGSDAVHGGAGNDRIIVSDDDFRLVDGGSGTDTFVFEGSGLSIDLTARGNLAITGIEEFDLTGTGSNTLKLARTDLFALSKTTDQLKVDGNAGDTLDLSEAIDASHWVLGATAGGYTTYTYGLATLQVGEFISVI